MVVAGEDEVEGRRGAGGFAGTQQEGIDGASSYCQRTFRAGLNSNGKIKHRKEFEQNGINSQETDKLI